MSADERRVPGGARLWAIVGAVGAVVVVVVVVVAIVMSRQSAEAPSASQSTSASESAAPSGSGTSEPADPSEPSDTGTSDAGTSADDAQTQPAEGTRPTASPVPLESTAAPAPGVQVTLRTIEAVDGVASLPGEVAGPSLRVTVDVKNSTDSDVDLTALVTNLYFGADRSPAIGLTEPGATAMPASVAAGQTATAVYVFNVPVDQRDAVVVEVDLSVDSTIVLFSGPVG